VQILGIVFAGTATDQRDAMAGFAERVLGLPRRATPTADFFALPDGSEFAVADPRSIGETSRTIGFLVADLDAALEELREADVEVGDGIGVNERWRYAHFRPPDGHVYELVEER
jgi:catechol 2,3-dioxygenase-like lactoylglutathione lyase family enzyme